MSSSHFTFNEKPVEPQSFSVIKPENPGTAGFYDASYESIETSKPDPAHEEATRGSQFIFSLFNRTKIKSPPCTIEDVYEVKWEKNLGNPDESVCVGFKKL